MNPDPHPRTEQQHEVQRLLGRCMLRLQQYESQMKALLVHHELGGPASDLAAQHSSRFEKYQDKSLGTLVKALFESVVVVEGTERPVLDETKLPTDRISFGFQFRMESPEARRAELKAAVENLVAMRNDLVHHLIERFDVGTEEGCRAATHHLTQCYDRIDLHSEQLRQWAGSMDEGRALLASFVQSDAFKELVVNGIAPDGAFDWPQTGIVGVLREAVQAIGSDGWASLEDATAWIAEHHPDQTPEKYQCRSWPQVLNDSRVFELQYRESSGERKSGWYRLRHEKT
jgi:hypothetical protein